MRNTIKLILHLACFASVILNGWSNASEEFQSLADIRNAAINFAAKNISTPMQNTTIKAARLDPRLRLKKCGQPLTTSPLGQVGNTANMTVIVKCNATAKPWTIYVPVKTHSYLTVAVTKRPIARGVLVTATDISLEQREINHLTTGYFENTEAIIGRQAKHSLAKGRVFSPRDLNIKKVISKGSRVNIMAEINGITVRMPGLALSDAGKGDQIRVQNLSSERTVIGTAVGPGIVKVLM